MMSSDQSRTNIARGWAGGLLLAAFIILLVAFAEYLNGEALTRINGTFVTAQGSRGTVPGIANSERVFLCYENYCRGFVDAAEVGAPATAVLNKRGKFLAFSVQGKILIREMPRNKSLSDSIWLAAIFGIGGVFSLIILVNLKKGAK